MKTFTKIVVSITAIFTTAFTSAQVSFTATHYDSGDNLTYSIANGDFNNDGVLDLVTVNGSTLSFYKGLGAGKFANPVNQTVSANLGQAVVADFNRDGRLDLAISSTGPNGTNGFVMVLLGNGNGTFTQGTNISISGGAQSLTLADFNGDHLPDMAVSLCTTSTCDTKIYLGQGNGTFKLSSTLTYGGGRVVAGDFNADGHQDIAVLATNELVMYLGVGNGSFQSPLLASQNDPVGLAVGDFYNNRIQSLAVLTGVPDSSGNFSYYVATARYLNGGLSVTSPQLAGTSQFLHDISGGDLTGDFKDDIVIAGGEKFGGGALFSYMVGNGDGTFQNAVSLPGLGQSEELPFVRDINVDGRHDIGAAWTNGYIVNGGGAYVLQNTSAPVNCAPPKPNALSVRICAPTNGQVVGKTFTFKAAGNAWNGFAKRMELWIDGKKIGQNLEDQLKVTTSLAKGPHKASFVVVDSFDNYVSGSVSFTSSY